MVAPLSAAGSTLNIRLGQSPDIKKPEQLYEFQLIYNSLHLLSQYMSALRENLESSPTQNPAESVRFRRTFWAIAASPIAVGAVCSSYVTGIINGVGVNQPFPSFSDDAIMLGSTSLRDHTGSKQTEFYIALTAANPGELVKLGVGPGIINLATAKCGQIVWAVGAISVNSWRNTGTGGVQYTTAGTVVGNGGLYLSNIIGKYTFATGGGYNWEGYWLPGYPNTPADGSGTAYYNRAYLYPVGICVLDGYVLFSDYKRSDSAPYTFT